MGLLNPFKMEMYDCLDYNIRVFKEKFRMLKVIKNRRERDNIAVGLYFKGESGYFEELPPPKEFKENNKLYEKYK